MNPCGQVFRKQMSRSQGNASAQFLQPHLALVRRWAPVEPEKVLPGFMASEFNLCFFPVSGLPAQTLSRQGVTRSVSLPVPHFPKMTLNGIGRQAHDDIPVLNQYAEAKARGARLSLRLSAFDFYLNGLVPYRQRWLRGECG